MSTTVTAWKARPMFVSSTFRDMQAERDRLRNFVFPLLEERLRERRVHLEPIDLRQGVETSAVPDEAGREMLVLKVCLDEIKRSRPFLFVLLGDRYGWVPPEGRMAAAAQEEGFQADLAGKSVTALEVEFGILKKDAEQKRRSFFFFRDPLPCQDPDFNDEFSPDPAVRSGHAKLEALKTKIATDPELGARVHHYQAGWDGRVILSEEWDKQVVDLIWPDLEEETRALAAQPPPTWEEAERQALAEFVEHRSLGFVGREEITQQLSDVARGDEAQSRLGACITGGPGSGKSALFAHLYSKLTRAQDAQLVLANAAGISARSGSVDAMLRRWIQELADFLNMANPLPEKATEEDVDNTFYSLLSRASQQLRVVVLIDALNQFEQSVRAQHLTWFRPKSWPANARIIASSLSCQPADILARSEGVARLELQPLAERDAEQIARNVWKRYHRQFNNEVYRALCEKRTSDGAAALGNPLWLNLALEQLNLLDADDFSRAEQEFTGSPEERLQAMQVDVARRLPAEVEGLFDWMLARAEKVHGVGWTRAFTAAIALSRFGWRESDLLTLVPSLAPALSPGWAETDYDALRLASLRRAFRGQVVRRGTLEQWDFFHAQMRASVLRRCVDNDLAAKRLHGLIADHLLSLPDDDSLRESETMHHLVEADDQPRAAHFYATVVHANPATETLARQILDATESDSRDAVEWIIGLLVQPGLASVRVAALCNRFQFDLEDALAITGNLVPRLRLLISTRDAGERLATADPSNTGWQRDLSVSHNKLGDVLRAQGDLAGALREYRAALEISERLATADPSNAKRQRDLSISHEKLGNVLRAQGDLAGALREYRADLEISERLATADSSNAGWQRDLSLSHINLGDVLRDQGDLAGALREYRASLQISERLTTTDPSNTGWQRNLSVSHSKLGDVLRDQGDLAGALREYRASLQISERLTAADPSNAGWQRDLYISYWRMAGISENTGQGDAMNLYRKAYEQLSGMKKRGIMQPADEKFLTRLQTKVGGR
ncbi:MAG: tetratricopeptide repeat protein [Candidatus Alcyoniella australis]|nr:tetratricopeptide repeat protein [Candidatus Alcyoniella australis]